MCKPGPVDNKHAYCHDIFLSLNLCDTGELMGVIVEVLEPILSRVKLMSEEADVVVPDACHNTFEQVVVEKDIPAAGATCVQLNVEYEECTDDTLTLLRDNKKAADSRRSVLQSTATSFLTMIESLSSFIQSRIETSLSKYFKTLRVLFANC